MSDVIVNGVKGKKETYMIEGREYPITLISMYDVDEYLAQQVQNPDVAVKHSWGWQWKDLEELSVVFKMWMSETNAHLYSDVKEDFYVWRGVQDAVKENKIVVVLDNMS